MKTFLLASGALLLASAAPAFAQDSAAPAPASDSNLQAPAPSSSFTGPRVEIFGGWDRVGVRQHDFTTGDTYKFNRDGGTAGVLAGYDMPIGNRLVGGVYGSYALSTAKDCVGGVGCLKTGRTIEAGARLGAKVMGDKALLYAKAAYVNGQTKADYYDGVDYIKARTDRDGWRAGAGVEYALNAHTYVKAEYDYSRFGRFNGDALGFQDTNVRIDHNQVLGGFGIRF